MGFIFKITSFIGGWIAVAVLALSVSAGLYLACELAEEYSSLVKKFLHRSTLGIGAFYILLAIDGLPFIKCLFGVVSYLSYIPLLTNFPFVQPVSVATIWALVVTLLNHLSWFNYFISDDYRYEHGRNYNENSFGSQSPALKVMGFLFIFVWVVPLGYFISLTSIEESLPMATGNQGGGEGQRKMKGLFKSFVDTLLQKKDEVMRKAGYGYGTEKKDRDDSYGYVGGNDYSQAQNVQQQPYGASYGQQPQQQQQQYAQQQNFNMQQQSYSAPGGYQQYGNNQSHYQSYNTTQQRKKY